MFNTLNKIVMIDLIIGGVLGWFAYKFVNNK